MILKVKKLREESILPCYAHHGDAGLDLFSCVEMVIPANEVGLIPTGIAIQLPSNAEAQIRPRSGLALNQKITVLNSPGTIDYGYRGEIGVILINHNNLPIKISIGMKIAQMVIKPVITVEVEEVYELTETQRGIGGFGSSGI